MTPTALHRVGYGTALSACLLWAVAGVVLMLVAIGPPPSAVAFGLVAGSLVVHALLAALPVWLIARRRGAGWAAWRLLLLALPCFLVVRLLLSTIG